MRGAHDLAPNSSVTSVIALELLLVANFACVSFSRENHRLDLRDFCNTIGQNQTFGTAVNLESFSVQNFTVCGEELTSRGVLDAGIDLVAEYEEINRFGQ